MKKSTLAVILAVASLLIASAPVLAIDRDGDGLRDFFEKKWGVTSPKSADSDGDGVVDSAEDSDGDRLSNLGEQRFRLNPGKRDTDRDGRTDGAEDHDRDGKSNALEQDQRPVPRKARPTLSTARSNFPPIRGDCFALKEVSTPLRCVFGDTGSDITVALFGDSHALMWAPAFIRAAAADGWKLVTFLKGGCPSVDVKPKTQWQHDRNASCAAWRSGVHAWMNAHPPDLIVMTNSDGYAVISGGKIAPSHRRPAIWRAGMTRTIERFPAQSNVLVFGDAPSNNGDPIKCLMRHRSNMSACQARRVPPARRTYDVIGREVAAATGAEFRTLYNKVCSYDPCPLVQGNTMMWRDPGHLTTAFVKRMTPSLRTMLAGVKPFSQSG